MELHSAKAQEGKRVYNSSRFSKSKKEISVKWPAIHYGGNFRMKLRDYFLLFAAMFLPLTASAIPVPLINQPLRPDAAAPGSPGFTLTVSGTGFVPASLVYWNGSPRSTTFVSQSKSQALIFASDVSTPRTVSVTVASSPGGSSNVVFFEVAYPRSWAALGAPVRFAAGAGPLRWQPENSMGTTSSIWRW